MEDKEILDIKKAIKALENKEVVVSNATYFVLKKGKIKAIGKNSSYELTIDDFIKLYEKNEFVIYEDNGVIVDYQKDDQYYNEFKHK